MKLLSHRLCILAAMAIGLTALGNLSAATPSPDEARARDLVRRLASESYKEREQASEELRKLGLVAKAALEQGIRDDDLEVRRRCLDLLPAVMEIDLKNRIAAFLADKEGKGNHDVPMWQRYRKVVGTDAAARQLFCEMLEGDALMLLMDCAEYANREGEILERYLRRTQQKMYQPVTGRQPGQFSRGELAAALFIGGLDPAIGSRQQGAYIVCNMLYQQAARNALSDGPAAPVVKSLLLRWMKSQTNEHVVMQLSQIIQNLNFKEGHAFLAEVIKEKKVRGIYLAQAAISLARLGGKEQVPILETLLADETNLGRVQFNTIIGDTQVKDVALAMLVHLTGQSHKDYGFCFISQQPTLLWAPNYLGFQNAQNRDEAHKKWKTWAASQAANRQR